VNPANSSEKIDRNRRRFLGTAAMTVASAHLSVFSSAQPEPETADGEKVMAAAQGTEVPH
jgi:hypothetical protein